MKQKLKNQRNRVLQNGKTGKEKNGKTR